MMTLPPFAAWAGPRNPRLVLVAEAWGQDEAAIQAPLVGASGQELMRMLSEITPTIEPDLLYEVLREMRSQRWLAHRARWLDKAGISMTNVFALRPPDNDLTYLLQSTRETKLDRDYPALPPVKPGAYLKREFFPELVRLHSELSTARPKIVVALGATAAWALTGSGAISASRGTLTSGGHPESPIGILAREGRPRDPHADLNPPGSISVLPTWHPAYVLRQWSARPVAISDLTKAWSLATSNASTRRPNRQVLASPTLLELADWVSSTLATGATIACDTETARGQITCVSFARSPFDAICVPFRNKTATASFWQNLDDELQAWNLIASLLESPTNPKVFQNGMYDLQFFVRMGIYPRNCRDDPMLLHHALYPELNKGLGFLGSIYTSEPAWKLMRRQRAADAKSAKKDA